MSLGERVGVVAVLVADTADARAPVERLLVGAAGQLGWSTASQVSFAVSQPRPGK